MFATRLYIQFSDTRLKVSSPQSPNIFECIPLVAIEGANGQRRVSAIGKDAEALVGKSGFEIVNPFAHPRLVIGDPLVALKLLQYGLVSFRGRRLGPLIMNGVLHAERPLEGGLSPMERKALVELGNGSGFRNVAVHEGPALSMHQVKSFKMRD